MNAPLPLPVIDEPVSRLLDRILLASASTSHRDLIEMVEMAKVSAAAQEDAQRQYAGLCHQSGQALGAVTSAALALCTILDQHVDPVTQAVRLSDDAGVATFAALRAAQNVLASIDQVTDHAGTAK